MATMVGEVYDALIEAGASQDKARKAAEAVAAFDSRINKSDLDQGAGFMRMEQRFAAMDQRISAVEQRLTKLEAKVDQSQWMIGLVLAGVAALIVRSMFPGLT